MADFDALGDAVKGVLNKFPKKGFVDLAANYYEYLVLPQLLRKGAVKVQGGTQIEWRVRVSTNQNFGFQGLFYARELSRRDNMVTATAPWTRWASGYYFDTAELAMNAGSEMQVFDFLKEQESNMWLEVAEEIEKHWWTTNVQSSDDPKKMYNVKTWIVKNVSGTSASTSDGGFNGGNPGGFISGVGLNSDIYAAYKNWAHQYVEVTTDDLVDKMAWGRKNTGWKSPVAVQSIEGPPKRAYYAAPKVEHDLERQADLRNDNAKGELRRFGGATGTMATVMVGGIPVFPVPVLADDSDDPIYQIDWGTFKTHILKGEWENRVGPKRLEGAPSTMAVDVYSSLNPVAMNRRRLAVFSTGVAADS